MTNHGVCPPESSKQSRRRANNPSPRKTISMRVDTKVLKKMLKMVKRDGHRNIAEMLESAFRYYDGRNWKSVGE